MHGRPLPSAWIISLFFSNAALDRWSSHQTQPNLATCSLLSQIWYMICNYYRAALNAGRSGREKGVRLSVRPSVKGVDCHKGERSFSLVFWEKKMIGGRRPLLPEVLGQTDRVGAKSPIFSRYSLVAPAVIPSDKRSINTNMKSILLAFQWA